MVSRLQSSIARAAIRITSSALEQGDGKNVAIQTLVTKPAKVAATPVSPPK
jgi:hypothetical protein